MSAPINEVECTFTHEGTDYTARGAFVSDEHAWVYVDGDSATDWRGNAIGSVRVVSRWRVASRWMGWYSWYAVRVTIDGREYAGRYCYDNGSLVKCRRVAADRRADCRRA